MKTNLQVVIDKKVLTLQCAEDEMFIQQVAGHLNKVIKDLKTKDEYKYLPSDMKPLFVELNITEDLIRAQKKIKELEEDIRIKENELVAAKQTIVDLKMKRN